MSARTERVEANQKLFRAGNGAIASTVKRLGGSDVALSFLCECYRRSCLEEVRLTVADYDRLTAGDRYVVLPGHEGPDEVCERRDGVLVVAK